MSTRRPPASTARGVTKLLRDGIKGEYSAGSSLYLSVNGVGAGSWIYRYMINGKRQRIGLGSASEVTLADANQRLAEQKQLVAQGKNPLEVREQVLLEQRKDTFTFEQVANDYIEAQRPRWKSAKHAQQWANTLATYAYPVIGDLAPADVTTEHLLKILSPIWQTKSETARRVRNRIELILNAAKARKLRDGENVAAWRGHLELLLTNTAPKAKHHPALDWREVKAFWQAIDTHEDTSAQALKLTILTGLRTSEVLGARWQEIDVDAAVWTVPLERMKAGKAHRVPLSKQALALLETLPRVSSGLLFEGQSANKPISTMAMSMKLRGLHERKLKDDDKGWVDADGHRVTVHGFRSTFRDWAAENTNFENIVTEMALAHTVGASVERAYRRGDLLERRRELMQAWANYLVQPADAKIIPLYKAG